MSLRASAKDWEVAGIMSLGGGGAGIAAGAWLFVFRSKNAHVKESVVFGGYGLGVGASWRKVPISGAGSVSLRPDSFRRIRVEQSFCLEDLNLAGGRLTQANLSVSLGYSWTCISAFTRHGPLFSSQDCPGFATGVSIAAVTTAGVWRVVSMNRADFDEGVHRVAKQVAELP